MRERETSHARKEDTSYAWNDDMGDVTSSIETVDRDRTFFFASTCDTLIRTLYLTLSFQLY
jgi:hypothetical protein